jgi:hypothetical protein
MAGIKSLWTDEHSTPTKVETLFGDTDSGDTQSAT